MEIPLSSPENMEKLRPLPNLDGFHEGPYPQIILFGDSLTQFSCRQDLGNFNLTPALQDAYIRRFDVINRGFSGYNTAQAKQVLPRFMPSLSQASVELVTVFFGANDACLPDSPSGQHIPLDEYVQNLKDIASHAAITAHQPKIVLITPPPINEYKLEFFDKDAGYSQPSRTAANTRRYATACRQVGRSLKVPVVDLWSTMMAAAGWKEGQPLVGSKDAPRNAKLDELLSDGLHFFSPAYKILYNELMKVVESNWPELKGGQENFCLPVWTEAPK